MLGLIGMTSLKLGFIANRARNSPSLWGSEETTTNVQREVMESLSLAPDMFNAIAKYDIMPWQDPRGVTAEMVKYPTRTLQSGLQLQSR